MGGKAQACLVSEACIGHQRNIGEGDFFRHEIPAGGKVPLHQAQNRVAAHRQVGVDLVVGQFQIVPLEAQYGDRGFVTVLLPEQPLVHQRAVERIDGDQVRAFGQQQDDGVGLGQYPPVGPRRDRHLAGRYRPWAIAAAWGDNLPDTARALAQQAGLDAAQADPLRELGESINYNAYGDCVEDLVIAPLDLYATMKPYESPFDFIASEPIVAQLARCRHEDLELAQAIAPLIALQYGSVCVLPDEPWDLGTWGAWTNAVKNASGRKGKDLFLPLRRALTGRDHGPELKNLLPLIGRARSLRRLAGETA